MTGVAMTPEGKRAVSGSRDRTLKVWDLDTGRAVRTLVGHSARVCDGAVTLGGKRAVSASADNNTLKVWDLYTGLPIAAFRCDAPAWWCAFAWRLSFE
jgi:WD40 repeat protein